MRPSEAAFYGLLAKHTIKKSKDTEQISNSQVVASRTATATTTKNIQYMWENGITYLKAVYLIFTSDRTESNHKNGAVRIEHKKKAFTHTGKLIEHR